MWANFCHRVKVSQYFTRAWLCLPGERPISQWPAANSNRESDERVPYCQPQWNNLTEGLSYLETQRREQSRQQEAGEPSQRASEVHVKGWNNSMRTKRASKERPDPIPPSVLSARQSTAISSLDRTGCDRERQANFLAILEHTRLAGHGFFS